MLLRSRLAWAALLGGVLCSLTARAADPSASLKKGTPDLKSAGPLAFGPDGILFVGDTQGAALFAIDTGDRDRRPPRRAPIKVEDLGGEGRRRCSGTDPKQVMINDLAVNPVSGKAYLSVSRGRGPDAVAGDPPGRRATASSTRSRWRTSGSPRPRSPTPRRRRRRRRRASRSAAESITDLAYVDGRVFVAGPVERGVLVAAAGDPVPVHRRGRRRRRSRSTTARTAGSRPSRRSGRSSPTRSRASPTCWPPTPARRWSRSPSPSSRPGAHVKGTTIAELGNRNRPLDMIVYQKDGKDYLLLANSSRGVMKIPTEGADTAEPITSPVRRQRKGLAYETIDEPEGRRPARPARQGPRPGPHPGQGRHAEPRDGRPAVSPWLVTCLAWPGRSGLRCPSSGRPVRTGRSDGPRPSGAPSSRPEAGRLDRPGTSRPSVGPRRQAAAGPVECSMRTPSRWRPSQAESEPRSRELVLAGHGRRRGRDPRSRSPADPRLVPGRGGDVLRFQPRFPLEPGLRYRAVFDPADSIGRSLAPLPATGRRANAPATAAGLSRPSLPCRRAGRGHDGRHARLSHRDHVAREPAQVLRPLLRPDEPGRGYDHIHLLDAAGKPVDLPVPGAGRGALGPGGHGFTLLFDPGRIKRGLKPREELGPVLEAGKRYTLVIDRGWPDAEGQPARRPFRKTFRVGPPDDRPPDPTTWTIVAPAAARRDPLVVTFPEPLDRALLGRVVAVIDARGGRRPRPSRDRRRGDPLAVHPRPALGRGRLPGRRRQGPRRPGRQQHRPPLRGRRLRKVEAREDPATVTRPFLVVEPVSSGKDN